VALMYQQMSYDIAAVMPAALATGLFVSLVTMQQPTGAQTTSGAPLLSGGDSGDGWNNVAGMVNIPAMNAPESDARIRADQTKSIEMVEGIQLRHMLLGGYYPAIEENGNWRAMVDGIAYDVRGVESDSQSQMTRLKLQISSI
jgi:hypothetical protein